MRSVQMADVFTKTKQSAVDVAQSGSHGNRNTGLRMIGLFARRVPPGVFAPKIAGK